MFLYLYQKRAQTTACTQFNANIIPISIAFWRKSCRWNTWISTSKILKVKTDAFNVISFNWSELVVFHFFNNFNILIYLFDIVNRTCKNYANSINGNVRNEICCTHFFSFFGYSNFASILKNENIKFEHVNRIIDFSRAIALA